MKSYVIDILTTYYWID